MSEAEPNNAANANRMGMAALSANDPAAAARHFERAVAGDPKAGALWKNLASAHRAMGDNAAERAALDAALDLDRTDFMAWLRKAELLERCGEVPAAVAAWSGVLQLSRQLTPLPEGLVQALSHGQNYVSEQQEALSHIIEHGMADALAGLSTTARRRANAFVDQLTRQRRIFRNECAGLYYPFLPADEFFDEHHFPWFAGLAAATPAIRAEFEALIANGDAALRPYVRLDKGSPQNKWSALDNNLDWGACFLWEYGKPNAPVLDKCPATKQALAALPQTTIPNRAPTAFFSLLKPRAHIPAHTGVSNTRAIIHLPLIVPDRCRFRVGGETREWVEGVPFAFDDTIEHEAWNDSEGLRVVLIFDVWNPHLTTDEQRIICQYYDAADRGEQRR